MINNMTGRFDPSKRGKEISESRLFTATIINPTTTRSATESGMIVEGYAATFNSPTVLYTMDGVDYKEVIDARAFEGADMTDVIFNYNHDGKVIARTSNNTLSLKTDWKGLRIQAKLDGTEEGRRLYEEIKGGYITKMSFMFSVESDVYERSTSTRKILKFKRIYDVSAVAIPAYNDTSIAPKLTDEQQRKRLLLILDTLI